MKHTFDNFVHRDLHAGNVLTESTVPQTVAGVRCKRMMRKPAAAVCAVNKPFHADGLPNPKIVVELPSLRAWLRMRY
jgi:predicted unusual protein kinase regulating ubiquinone biosynthesis (AarF/ABC1/UbiB family)